MHVGSQKIAQRIVHHALPLDSAAAGEDVGDDYQAEVALSLRSSARVAGMARRIVGQLEPFRLQPGQTCAHLVRDPHRRSLAPSAFAIARNRRSRAACGGARTIAVHANCVKLISLAIEAGYHYLPMIGEGQETNQG
jgi:hypothetical protein